MATKSEQVGQQFFLAQPRQAGHRSPQIENWVIEALWLVGPATVNQVAEKAGITYGEAYAAIHRLRRKGIVVAKGYLEVENRRPGSGHPERLYALRAEASE